MDQINFNIGIPLLIQDQSDTIIYMDNQNRAPNVYPNFFQKSDEVKRETFFIDPVKDSYLNSEVFGNKTFVINHENGEMLRIDPRNGVKGMLSEGENPGPEVFFNGQVVQLADGPAAFEDDSRPERNEVYTPVRLYNGNVVYLLAGSLTNNDSEIVHERVAENGAEEVGEDLDENVEEGADNSEEATEELTSVVPLTKQEKSKGFQCSYKNCNKSYTSFHHLKVHLRVHTGDRPFRCNVEGCNKTFSTGFGLKTHFRTHNGERPYTCNHENCEKGFKTSGDLQKHIRTHTGERPFLCPIPNCGRSFTTCNICKVHVRTHTGERPYKCTYPDCDKKFASATNQRNHMRIHSGEKPYVCPVEKCGRRFTEYSSLYKHNMVHRQQPHLCLVCGKTYRQASGLMMHTKSVHGDQETFLMVDKSPTEEAKEQEEPTAILFVNNIKMEEDGVLEDPLFNELQEETQLND